jgi:hypothetical protein
MSDNQPEGSGKTPLSAAKTVRMLIAHEILEWYLVAGVSAILFLLVLVLVWSEGHSAAFYTIFAIILLLVPFWLYRLRNRRRRIYGLLEIAFGVWAILSGSGILALGDLDWLALADTTVSQGVSVVGGVYVYKKHTKRIRSLMFARLFCPQ